MNELTNLLNYYEIIHYRKGCLTSFVRFVQKKKHLLDIFVLYIIDVKKLHQLNK